MDIVYFTLMMGFIVCVSDASIQLFMGIGNERRQFPYTQLAIGSACVSLIFGLHALLDAS